MTPPMINVSFDLLLQCHDEWFSRSCICQRPFFGNLCENSYPAATFGFMSNVSWIKVPCRLAISVLFYNSMRKKYRIEMKGKRKNHLDIFCSFQVNISPEQAESIAMSTEISLFVLTRSPSGLIFYLGTEPTQQPQESYLAGVLEKGFLKVILKVDSSVYQMQVDSVSLDDGQLHYVEVRRNQSALLVNIDQVGVINMCIILIIDTRACRRSGDSLEFHQLTFLFRQIFCRLCERFH